MDGFGEGELCLRDLARFQIYVVPLGIAEIGLGEVAERHVGSREPAILKGTAGKIAFCEGALENVGTPERGLRHVDLLELTVLQGAVQGGIDRRTETMRGDLQEDQPDDGASVEDVPSGRAFHELVRKDYAVLEDAVGEPEVPEFAVRESAFLEGAVHEGTVGTGLVLQFHSHEFLFLEVRSRDHHLGNGFFD